jgi:hypothetical protein
VDIDEKPPRTMRRRWLVVGVILAALAVAVLVIFLTVPQQPAAKPVPTPGVPAGTKLTVVHGDLTVRQKGAVVKSVDVRGRIIVLAPNVTIRDSIIRGAKDGSKGGLIDAMQGEPGLQVRDSEIFATTPNPYVNGIQGSNFTLERVNIHDVIDQVHIVGDHVTVADSWLHGNVHYENDPVHGGGPTHDDNVQIQVGSHIVIRDNRMSGAHNAVVQITQDMGAVGDVAFAGNQATDGWCSINVSEGGGDPVKKLAITDNVFGRSMTLKNCAVIAPPSTKVAMSGNRFEDGGTVKVRKGA